MLDTPKRSILGKIFEQKACGFLKKQGLTLLEKNYRTPFGEIDLIMQEKTDLVFVEVRYRLSNVYGDAVESIDTNKQKKILKSALHFLQKKDWLDQYNCRFDVIGYSKYKIIWIKDAFSEE